jgi:DNA mismatch repair protein MutS
VSKGQADKIPASYLRKQTLVGNERFTTEKLQKFETDVLSASEKIVEIEDGIIKKLLGEILEKKAEIQKCAESIGDLDFFISLARVAKDRKFTRPVLSENGTMAITDGRHPVVEAYYTKEIFIPNDILFDSEENMIKVITGPNMSGKSTYIRMSAMIQLMAQIGSFVPASSAEISIVDRIFTRIGASDNISRGESTFLVEMNETATILNNATDRSLIVMDEVGRGTSTYDGLSLAWAIVEYIMKFIRAKTLFATHYHELTKLSDRKGIVNYNVLVHESAGGVDFLHKVVPGAADKSYGIHVAKLAGIPKDITQKAQKILERLEKTNKRISVEGDSSSPDTGLDLFNAANHRVIQAIRQIDLDKVTPLDALNELSRLKKLIDE